MLSRNLFILVILAASCATAGGKHRSATSRDSLSPSAPLQQVPDLFRRPPWSTNTDSSGNYVHVQTQAHVQFPARIAELRRKTVRIYDEKTNDVGFSYLGAFPESSPTCLFSLSVYVYPATEAIATHVAAVETAILRANPGARAVSEVINLDHEHGGVGAHVGNLNEMNGLESFEGGSVFERAGWFIKYRSTIHPGLNHLCEQQIRNAVTSMQVR